MKHISAALAAAAILTLAGCSSSPGTISASSPATPYVPPTYTYEVEGIADDATVTLATPNGQEQHTIKNLSVEANAKQRWTFTEPMPFLYVSVQGGSEITDVTCRIKMDGQILAQNTSDAAFGVATCQAA